MFKKNESISIRVRDFSAATLSIYKHFSDHDLEIVAFS